MSCRRVQLLIVVVAMLHLAADAAFASSAVLCVGSDGHRAVESEHTGANNHAAPDWATTPTGASLAGAAPVRCLDQPIHPNCAEMASERIDGSEIGTLLTYLPGQMASRPATGRQALVAARTFDVLPPGTHEHRTTVLLI